MKRVFALLAVVIFAAACESNPPGVEKDPDGFLLSGAKGKVHGMEFSAKSAQAVIYSSRPGIMTVALFPQNFDDVCNPDVSEFNVMFDVPENAKGTVTISNRNTIRFVRIVGSGTTSISSNSGKLIIDEVGANTISGRVASRFNDNNEINGVFTAKICNSFN